MKHGQIQVVRPLTDVLVRVAEAVIKNTMTKNRFGEERVPLAYSLP